MTIVYSDGDGIAKHFTGTGTAQAVEVELVGGGKMIQILVRLDLET